MVAHQHQQHQHHHGQPPPHPQPSPLDSQGGHSPASSSNTSQTPQTTPTSATSGGAASVGGSANPGNPGGVPRDAGPQKVCGRPGCSNPVQRNADGWIGEYCSNECVVGQCQEVYTSWSSRSGQPYAPCQPQTAPTAAVK